MTKMGRRSGQETTNLRKILILARLDLHRDTLVIHPASVAGFLLKAPKEAFC